MLGSGSLHCLQTRNVPASKSIRNAVPIGVSEQPEQSPKPVRSESHSPGDRRVTWTQQKLGRVEVEDPPVAVHQLG
jgi:hypothetical protein